MVKAKDLIGIPWRLAFALQADGWYLRSEIIWYKPNAQPESVKDRPTRAHEHIFLLTKSERYFYDYEAMKEPAGNGSLKNCRTVWAINTEPFPDAHFATFPTKLVELCMLASTRPGDTVLDPFFGSGTVGLVARYLGRRYIGIELNPEYVKIAQRRLSGAICGPLRAKEGKDEGEEGHKILGNYREIQRQIGNAVPSLLAEVLGRKILRDLLGKDVSSEKPLLGVEPKRPIPESEPVQEVPKKYLSLIGNHKPHPGSGKGPKSKQKANQTALFEEVAILETVVKVCYT